MDSRSPQQMAHFSSHIFIFFFLFLSLHLIVEANSHHEYYFHRHVEKLAVAGVDDSREKEGFIVEKVKAFLLGMRSFHNPSGREVMSPTPSPSPTMAPNLHDSSPSSSPSPVHGRFHSHPHFHPELGYSRSRRGNRMRVLAAVLGSAGGAVLVCVIGFICVCWKFRRQRRKNRSGRKVSVNPGLDLIYMNSLEMEMEFGDSENVQMVCHDHALFDKSEKECDDSGNASSLSVREILFARNDDADSVKRDDDDDLDDDHDGVLSIGNKIAHDDDDDDDDNDSFHSFCDSNSNSTHLRLSNASINSLSEKSEVSSPKVSKNVPSYPNPSNSKNPNLSSPPNTTLETQSSSNDIEKSSRIVQMSISSGSTPPNHVPQLQSSPTNIPPPPPCLPPFPRPNGKGPPPPPPLSPLGKDGSPLPKLKPLHWDKVRATPDRSMAWDKMRSSSFELDEEMMESLFGYNLQSSMKNDDGKSKTPSPGKHILDQKRLQNITILSKALNATSEQISYALVQGEGLCLQQLEALAKMVLTKEEEMKVCSYKGDMNEVGSAERFMKAVLSVPFAFLRIEAMLYRETFEDEVVHLRKSFSMLEEACKELKSSRLFLKLLEAVLKTGNRMNVGTIRGGAKAFKLDTLLKLSDIKGTDGKTSLLHFVVQEIIRSEGIRVSNTVTAKINSFSNKTKTSEEKEEEYKTMGLDLVAGLSAELCNVKKTATVDLDVLASSVSNLARGMAKLRQLVDNDLRDHENGGNFVMRIKGFLCHAEKRVGELQEEESNVMGHVREVTEYFHGEVSKTDTNQLRIFVIVRDFMGMLDSVCKELRSFKAPNSPNPMASFR